MKTSHKKRIKQDKTLNSKAPKNEAYIFGKDPIKNGAFIENPDIDRIWVHLPTQDAIVTMSIIFSVGGSQ